MSNQQFEALIQETQQKVRESQSQIESLTSRIEKARALLNERRRRLQELSLLDCLQLSDKTQIVARHPPLRNLTRFSSRRSMEEATKRLEKLRNNLTHSQDIVSSDWEAIVSLAENLDDILEGPISRGAQESV